MDGSGFLHAPAALSPGKGASQERVHIEQEAVWAPELIWKVWKQRTIICLCRGSEHNASVGQTTAQPLHRLRYTAS